MEDLTQLSDNELDQRIQSAQQPQSSNQGTDLTKLSDDELDSKIQQAKSSQQQNYIQEMNSSDSPQVATTNIDTVPIYARAMSGFARTPKGQVDILNKVCPALNAQLNQDGEVYANGKPYKLAPEDGGAALYDLPGMVGEALIKNLPLVANLGAAAATGGMSIPAQMAIQTAATGGMEAAKEMVAQGLVQEKPSGADIGTIAAAGAAGPLFDLGLVATGKGLASAASSLQKLVGPGKDILPEFMNLTSGIRLGVGDKVADYLDKGTDLSTVLNQVNGAANRPSQIMDNTFFGSKGRTPQAFVDTLKENVQNAGKNADSVKKMYGEIWGLSPQTIETIVNNKTGSIVNSELFNDSAPLTVASNFAKYMHNLDGKMTAEYGQTLASTIQKVGASKAQVNIGSALGELFRAGGDVNAGGVGIFKGLNVNDGYTGTAAKKVYGELLSKLEDKSVGIQSPESKKILTDLMNRNPNGLPADVVSKLTQGGYFKSMPADQAYQFLAEIKPLLNKTFEGGGLSGSEKGPLAGFMKNIRGQLGELSPEMKAMNERYTKYEGIKSVFGNIKPGNLAEMRGLAGSMEQIYRDPTIRSSIADIDKSVGPNHVLKQIDQLGASQEVKDFAEKKMQGKYDSFVSGIKGLADKTATHAQDNMDMAGYDSLLSKDRKFLDPMWRHVVASEFATKPMSIFKAKYLGLLSLGSLGLGHLGIGAAIGVGSMISNPRNLAKSLLLSQRLSQGGATKTAAANAIGTGGKILGRLIANKTGQSVNESRESSRRIKRK